MHSRTDYIFWACLLFAFACYSSKYQKQEMCSFSRQICNCFNLVLITDGNSFVRSDCTQLSLFIYWPNISLTIGDWEFRITFFFSFESPSGNIIWLSDACSCKWTLLLIWCKFLHMNNFYMNIEASDWVLCEFNLNLRSRNVNVKWGLHYSRSHIMKPAGGRCWYLNSHHLPKWQCHLEEFETPYIWGLTVFAFFVLC